MPEASRKTHGIELPICGVHNWFISSSESEVLVVYESNRPPKKRLAKKLRLGTFGSEKAVANWLRRIMYPVRREYQIRIETLSGEIVVGQLAEHPGFGGPREIVKIETWARDKTGTQTSSAVWQPDMFTRDKRVHKIDVGKDPYSRERVMWEVPGNSWPPAVFLVGNNQIVAIPIVTLTDDFLDRLNARIAAFARAVGEYEDGHFFLTASARPPKNPPGN